MPRQPRRQGLKSRHRRLSARRSIPQLRGMGDAASGEVISWLARREVWRKPGPALAKRQPRDYALRPSCMAGWTARSLRDDDGLAGLVVTAFTPHTSGAVLPGFTPSFGAGGGIVSGHMKRIAGQGGPREKSLANLKRRLLIQRRLTFMWGDAGRVTSLLHRMPARA